MMIAKMLTKSKKKGSPLKYSVVSNASLSPVNW